MLLEPNRAPMSAHVVVLGNEKGGSGKSTTAMHVAIALTLMGQRVATIDLDSRQKSFTRYIDNRRAWARHARLNLKLPVHFCVARGTTLKLDENESIEFAGFAEAVSAVERSHDFVVVDTPGTDSYLTRLAHSMADTLITPLNDSFVDLDVIGTVDATTYSVSGESHYALMVRNARRQRRLIDGTRMDWIVVRNRLSILGSRNKRLVGQGLGELAARLGFRCAEGLAERVIYRELFPRGLTALDNLDEPTLGTKPSLSHAAARLEVMSLVEALRLPLDARGKRRAAARSEWFAALEKPLETHDVVDG
ncbi:MAG: division plane positioning ATPase MipZ [Xanthobacteraceae bacterium]|jgi:chromosome partitioning protein